MREAAPPKISWLYLRAHRVPSQLIIFLVITVADVFFGQAKLAIPSAQGVISVQIRREFPLLFAVIAVGSLHSAMESAERSAGPRLPRWEAWHLGLATGMGAGLMWLAEAFGIGEVISVREMCLSRTTRAKGL